MWHPDSSPPPETGSLPLSRTVLVGVGNSLRSDDGAGLRLCRLFRERHPGLEWEEQTGDSFVLLDLFERRGDRILLLADAVQSGAPAGTLFLLSSPFPSLPSLFRSGSTHDFGLSHALRMGETLGRLPGKMFIVGIEGREWGYGESLTPAVERGVSRAVEEMERWVNFQEKRNLR